MIEIIVPDYAGLVMTDIAVDVPAVANRSIITSRRQVVGQPGSERWYLSAYIDAMATENDERAWRAFTFGMKGIQNYFKFRVGCQQHSGAMPTVAAGANAGYTLPLTGMTANTTILLAGNYMTVPLPSGHKRLVCLLTDLVANGVGAGLATFNVALNQIPALGVVVETKEPYVPVNSTERRMGLQYTDGVSGVQLTLEEAI